MSEVTRKFLCSLVDQGFTAEIKGTFGQSSLLRWGEGDEDEGDNECLFEGLKPENWYVFEIGRNLGTIFSANCVESVTIKDRHAIIHLKG